MKKKNSIKIGLPLVEITGGKKALIGYIDSFIKAYNLNGDVKFTRPENNNKYYLSFVCGCGKEYNYKTKKDVPSKNVICKCGQEIITYNKLTK